MATNTDIVNVALRRVGTTRIGSLDTDSSKEAQVARDLYDEARRDILNLHNWNFAIKRDQLTAAATEPDFGWDYAYPLPEDLIRLISVHPHNDDESVVPYRLEFMQGQDRVLLTNSNQIYVRYIFDLEDPNLMSAAFRDVLAWRLARDFAVAITQSVSAAENSERMYSRNLARAKAIDGIEDYPEKMADGSWLTSRWPDTSRA